MNGCRGVACVMYNIGYSIRLAEWRERQLRLRERERERVDTSNERGAMVVVV